MAKKDGGVMKKHSKKNTGKYMKVITAMKKVVALNLHIKKP